MSQVFIFSACWRTGSTLVQRFFNTSDDLLIWGEPNFLLPFGNAFDKSVGHFKSVAWQQEVVEKQGFQKAWSPVLNPKVETLLEGYRAFFNTTYGLELTKFGKSRWGFKEVRQNAYQHASMMKQLFPDSKIIFHYRNPYDVYESLLGTDFHKNFQGPFQPMRFWAKNMRDFLDSEKVEKLDALVISHEEFVAEATSQQVMQELANFTNTKLTEKMKATIQLKVGATSQQSGLDKPTINRLNQVLLEELGEQDRERVMSLFGGLK
ncbi:sulfotransferase [Vibrio hannami]|uniref:sulfotransferase n=1 Tax=Vibrio hannami TaxID=2717094 RepID=UPI00240EBF66|nr:sulfotransferase [Vibrio hannami]MDG3088644.1 sulfotransferase [Vibrio hannami]